MFELLKIGRVYDSEYIKLEMQKKGFDIKNNALHLKEIFSAFTIFFSISNILFPDFRNYIFKLTNFSCSPTFVIFRELIFLGSN